MILIAVEASSLKKQLEQSTGNIKNYVWLPEETYYDSLTAFTAQILPNFKHLRQKP